MELLLHTRLDTKLEAAWRGYPVLLRYVDNLTFVSHTERDGLDAQQITESILVDLGLTLKNQDGPPQDIRGDFDAVVLGLIPRWRDGHLTFTIPESAFSDLQEGFTKALATPKPFRTANRIANG